MDVRTALVVPGFATSISKRIAPASLGELGHLSQVLGRGGRRAMALASVARKGESFG